MHNFVNIIKSPELYTLKVNIIVCESHINFREGKSQNYIISVKLFEKYKMLYQQFSNI